MLPVNSVLSPNDRVLLIILSPELAKEPALLNLMPGAAPVTCVVVLNVNDALQLAGGVTVILSRTDTIKQYNFSQPFTVLTWRQTV